MKGITAVVSIILLLLITISMVGFAFLYFNRILTTTTTTGEEQMNQQNRMINTKGMIDVIDTANGKIYVRNTGTETIKSGEWHLYNSTMTEITGTSCGNMDIPVSGSVTCAPTTPSIVQNCVSIKLTTIGTGDERIC
ncbi:MAG: hypothetical protein V1802_01310 [Candidatus Aenigmatarchaeota archaeon]